MTDSSPTVTTTDAPMGPRRCVEALGSRYLLLGTAHVSRASADEVRTLIRSGEHDAVAIELCTTRQQALLKPGAMDHLDLIRVVREGKAGLVAASLALGAFQQRVADQCGIKPGAEMLAAIEEANAAGIPILLIDRDIGVTLRRVYASVPWWQRFNLLSGLMAGVLSKQSVSPEEIERLKQGDVLESTFNEFAQASSGIYRPLIEERDRYMALRLHQQNADGQYARPLVVVGAGHLAGLAEQLAEDRRPANPTAELRELDTIPPRSRWPARIPWIIVGLVLLGFVIGFSRNADLGLQLVSEWFLINGTLAAIGAIVALAHPVTVIAAFVAAPFTSLNPTIGVGMVTAFTELSLRRPTVGDFSKLRGDVTSARGWWRNRVSRVLLVFMLTTLGSATGTYVAGFRIIERLVGS